jgi:hypothetical protein
MQEFLSSRKSTKTIRNIFLNPFAKAKTLCIFARRFWHAKVKNSSNEKNISTIQA